MFYELLFILVLNIIDWWLWKGVFIFALFYALSMVSLQQ